ncbi:hypothetical protein ACWCOV_24600 [Kribbella sp. NPDC002412]
MEKQDVEFVFRDEDIDTVRAILENEGAEHVDEVEEADLLPAVVIVIAASIALVALSNAVIKLLRVWKCGLLIDARGSLIHTEKNCDLPRGTILVFDKEGTQHTLHEPSESDLAGLIAGAVGA